MSHLGALFQSVLYESLQLAALALPINNNKKHPAGAVLCVSTWSKKWSCHILCTSLRTIPIFVVVVWGDWPFLPQRHRSAG